MVMDAHFLITSECMAVTSAMRKSPRWANAGISAILAAPADVALESSDAASVSSKNSGSTTTTIATDGLNTNSTSTNGSNSSSEQDNASSVSGQSRRTSTSSLSSQRAASSQRMATPGSTMTPESQLILGFSSIRTTISSRDPSKFSIYVIAKPFLEIVKSPLVSGHITSLALVSLQKFLTLGVFRADAVDARKCANQMAYALTHCRFEATDRQEDDAVLLQLMALLEALVSDPFGHIMAGSDLHGILDTCLNMAKQMRLRDALRRSVVSVLTSLVRTLFDPKRSDESVDSTRAVIFKEVVDQLNPTAMNNNSIRLLVLNILTLVFEINGEAVTTTQGSSEYAKQLKDAVDDLWRYLAQVIRNTQSPKLVHEALVLVATIMNAAPTSFKAQFEFVLVYLLTSLTPLSDLPRDDSTDDMFYAGVPNRAKSVKSAPIEPGSSTLSIPTAALQKTPEIREVMMEALVTMTVASPTIFADLFVTYDCDKASPDLCEDFLGFLCRNAYPDSATWSTASVPPLCLEAVLAGLNAWTKLVQHSDERKEAGSQLLEKLTARKSKALESSVAEIFNKSPSKGIKAMYDHNFVKRDDPKDLARFIHGCQRINKAVLGKYFAKSENKEVLEHYVDAFDFSGKRIDESLRVLLCSFRLPGESQQIENLLQKFADHYIAYGDKVENTSDSAFILAYAVLMLNTDHFSPTVKRRMDFEAFKKNVQGVNKDIPTDYVQAIFDGITSNEIIMPEEHDTDETFDFTWRETVAARQPAEPFEANVRQVEVAKAVFEINWRPIVSTLSFVFATATDDLVFRRVIAGFHQLAYLAARFHAQQALTHIIACLSQISALTSGDLSFPNSNIEIRIEDSVSVIVSDLSTQIGDDLKAQMASITLFRIMHTAASEINHSAYSLLSKALTNLHLYGLGTPSAISGMQPLPPVHTFERSKAGKPVGIFSALSSYLTSSVDVPAEPSDESVDAALGATDCIKVCDIDGTLEVLIARSPKSFAQGALDVVPKEAGPKYLPAKRFLLQLAGAAARELPELRAKISSTALEAELIATALSSAPNEEVAAEILGKIDTTQQLDSETLAALFELKPTPEVWRLLAGVSKPDKAVADYVVKHTSTVTGEHLEPVLAMLAKGSDEKASIAATYAVASALRQSAADKKHYLGALKSLAAYCGRASSDTRESALSELQGELLLEDQRATWAEAANEVLLPGMLEVLLKPEVWKRDPSGMDLTRQQASSILGKVFLHLTVSLKATETKENTDAWIAVLKGLDRLLSSRRQPALRESVVEMLKNVVLVTQLASQGSAEFWERMQKELSGFLPDVAKLATQKSAETLKPAQEPSKDSAEPVKADEAKEASKDEVKEASKADAKSTKEEKPENDKS